jgi:hypothetical protein
LATEFFEQMRVVTFLNSLSEVSALSAVLSALRATDDLSWIKATTQILLESDMKASTKRVASTLSPPWFPALDLPAHVIRAERLAIAALTTLIKLVIITVIRHVMEHVVQEITLIVVIVIAALTIVKDLEVRANGDALHAAERHERASQEVDQRHNRFEDNGNDNAHRARAEPAIRYHRRDRFDNTVLSSDDDKFDRAASAIAAAHHVGDKIHSQTFVIDSGATRHMFYDLSVFQKLKFIAPTTFKLGDDSTTDCTQIGEVVHDVSDGRRIRLNQVLYVPRLAINLLSVSQLAKMA